MDAGARHVLPRSAQIQGLLRKAGHAASTVMQIGLVLEKGVKVVIAGRDEERGAKAFEELKAVSRMFLSTEPMPAILGKPRT